MSFGIAQGCFHWVFPSEFALEWPHSREGRGESRPAGERLWQGSEGAASLGPLLCAQAARSAPSRMAVHLAWCAGVLDGGSV